MGNSSKGQRERERERERAAELTRFVVSLVEERVAKGGMKHTVPPEGKVQMLRKALRILYNAELSINTSQMSQCVLVLQQMAMAGSGSSSKH